MSVMIIEDVGNKEGLHKVKNRWFDCHDVEVLRAPLPVGDYIIATDAVFDVIKRKTNRGVDLKKMDFLGSYKVSVDTKKDMQEIVGNICGKAHARFRDECILAQNNGIRLYVLVENEDGIKSIDDVFRWQNPRMERYSRIAQMHNYGKWLSIPLPKGKPTGGETLGKCLLTLEKRYGVKFQFCTPEEAGERVLSILLGNSL